MVKLFSAAVIAAAMFATPVMAVSYPPAPHPSTHVGQVKFPIPKRDVWGHVGYYGPTVRRPTTASRESPVDQNHL
jgi:hypothetical protein